MDLDTSSAIAITLIFISLAITSFFFLKKKDTLLTVVDRKELSDEYGIITFAHSKDKKMKINPGQSICLNIRLGAGETHPKYYPIKANNQTLQFLVRTKVNENSSNNQSNAKFWGQVKPGNTVSASMTASCFKYEGNKQIKVTFYDKKTLRRQIDQFWIIAEGEKISAVYCLCDTISKEHKDRRSKVNILFKGQKCPMKQQFQPFRKDNPSFTYEFCHFTSKEALKQQNGWSKIVKKWYNGSKGQQFVLICMQDSCQGVLSQNILSGMGVPQSRIYRL